MAKVVEGRVVVITGGSSGIGLATARVIAAAGARTILIARTAEALEAAKSELSLPANPVFTYQADISDLECLPDLVKRIYADHGKIDILINNAGRSIRRSLTLSFDRLHDFQRTMNLNYFGAIRIILLVLPDMIRRRSGHIINISSIGVQANAPRFSAYVASKAALDAFSRCAASEFLDHNIQFTTISMPLVRTPMTSPTRFSKRAKLLSPEQAASLVTKAIIRKPARVSTIPGTLAQVAHFLFPNVMLRIAARSFGRARDSDAAQGIFTETGEARRNQPSQIDATNEKME